MKEKLLNPAAPPSRPGSRHPFYIFNTRTAKTPYDYLDFLVLSHTSTARCLPFTLEFLKGRKARHRLVVNLFLVTG